MYTVARRYNADGENGIGDGRHGTPGGARLLSEEQQAELARAVEGAAPDGGTWTAGRGRRDVDGGTWTAAKVVAWIAARTGRRVGIQTGWRYLRRRDWRRYRPRPQPVQADPEAQAAFQQTR